MNTSLPSTLNVINRKISSAPQEKEVIDSEDGHGAWSVNVKAFYWDVVDLSTSKRHVLDTLQASKGTN
jgi:hypothetical protein